MGESQKLVSVNYQLLAIKPVITNYSWPKLISSQNYLVACWVPFPWFIITFAMSLFQHLPSHSLWFQDCPLITVLLRPISPLRKWNLIFSYQLCSIFFKIWSSHWHNHPGSLALHDPCQTPFSEHWERDSSAFTAYPWLSPLRQNADWKDCREGFH